MRKVYTASKMKDETVNMPQGNYKGVPGKDFVRKSDLVDGEYYYGHCRNSRCARWSEKDQEFTYMRTKFGAVFPETINHPEDDNGFDLFVPYFRCYPTKAELISDGDMDARTVEENEEAVAKLTRGIP